MKVCCVFSLELPHQGNSNEYTQYTIFNMKKKITRNYSKSAAMGFFQGTQELVQNSHGKQDICVQATEGLLYYLGTVIILLVCNLAQKVRLKYMGMPPYFSLS